MDHKDILGLAAVILGAVSYIPYFYGMYRREVTPHFFTWFIWALICAIGYAAQLSDGAGPGGWVMVFTAVVCAFIAVLSLKWGEKTFTRSDKACFTLSLLAIPLWVVTKDPLWSVILISLIDLGAFWPTVRKSWPRPWSEGSLVYLLCAVKFGLSLFAMDNLSLVTGLYAGSMVAVYGAFYVMLLARRRVVPRPISVA